MSQISNTPDGINDILNKNNANSEQAKAKVQNMLNKMDPEQRQKIDNILKDKEKTRQILSTPQRLPYLETFAAAYNMHNTSRFVPEPSPESSHYENPHIPFSLLSAS